MEPETRNQEPETKNLDLCGRCGEEHLLNYLLDTGAGRLRLCRACGLKAAADPEETGLVFQFGEEGAICLNG